MIKLLMLIWNLRVICIFHGDAKQVALFICKPVKCYCSFSHSLHKPCENSVKRQIYS